MALAAVSLDDKYEAQSGRVFLTGVQALIRLPMMQRDRDAAAGLNTAGFISGYRGSPLGALDLGLWRAQKFLKKHHIEFQPGLNEDLAATAIWGSQQLNLFPGAKYDGVFSMWYGKGPGVDRCGDVFRHANAAGTSRHGGVLAVAGDDHVASSSTLPHQTDHNFVAAMIPLLYPAGVQDILDFGMLGWAMSRYSGCWVGLKSVAETVESSASVSIDPDRFHYVVPNDFEMPEGGLGMRWPDVPLEQEYRLQRYKAYAALAFARANKLDHIVVDSPKPRFGIVTAGKSYLDVRQALDDLGIDDAEAARIGIRVYKVGMVWPLERDGMRQFAEGLEEILVVEEKRAIIENQLKEQLYNWREDVRPRVVGKFDEKGEWILPSSAGLTPAQIARVIAARIGRFYDSPRIRDRLGFLEAKERQLASHKARFERIPYFCSGCPHNTSTRVPEGSRAVAGIGCHYMSQFMDRNTATFTHMGGEGASWIGQAAFSEDNHIFANLGDGTYYHSGILAIRACVAAKVNITYKILYNDAVAMTGGQPVEGQPTVPQISHQLAAEGVGRIAVVTDQPDKYPVNAGFAAGATIHHRDDLDQVQRDIRQWPGVSAIIYDQTCAAEKRRRRKRKQFPDPPKRVFINEMVCEGCGDCGVQSNCVSVIPLETEFGRKRAIDQSSCNKDYSCVKGFCPSFVTVHGGAPRKRKPAARLREVLPDLPEPTLPALDHPYGILLTGIGGTGVITVGALLGMAAHVAGKGVSVLDMTGLAQKNGAVISHVRIAERPEDIHAVRIAAGEADAIIGCDLVVAAGGDALAKMRKDYTRAVINSYEAITADFTRSPDLKFPGADLHALLAEAVGPDAVDFIDATHIATALMGDSIAANMFMLGFAYQKGLVPLPGEAIDKAIELNGVAIEANRQSFLWGRRAAVDRAAVEKIAMPAETIPQDRRFSRTLDEIVARRVEDLTAYQDAAYARRYESLVRNVQALEAQRTPGRAELAEAVARYYYKLLAYKDEYEVARLYSDGRFRRQLREAFDGDYRLEFSLAPPLFAPRDAETGHLKKVSYGPWMLRAFDLLAQFKGLRGSWLDPFGHTGERKAERALIGAYEATIAELLAGLNADNHALAVEIASIPEHIRGYGHIKDGSLEGAKHREAELLKAFRAPAAPRAAAE
jgi:indolepyruvate ferredoxin oxidoreductase